MTRLVPAPLSIDATFDPVEKYPDDVAKLIAAAQSFGYEVSPFDVGEIWKRASESVCATWRSPMAWSDARIVEVLLQFAHEAPVRKVPPPTGYTSWLDFAVEMLDTRALEIENLLEDNSTVPTPTRDEMVRSAKAELDELRLRAGQSST